jgi:Tfp pilus assembly protein PilX
MKTSLNSFRQHGSVLVTALLTITILTLICVTSLLIASQNANSASQAASWQQALSAAESAVDQAIAALNTSTWTNWVTVNGSVPNLQPNPSPSPAAATAPPASNQYNYISSSISPQTTQYNVNGDITSAGEGNPLVSLWTTIDTAGLPLDANGNQWYRIRATGTAAAVGPVRISNQRLDNDLRKIGLRFDRKTNNALATPQATRTIEVVVQMLPQSIWVRGVTLKSSINMSGGGIIDSFNSGDLAQAPNHLYDITKLHTAPFYYGNHGDVATINSGTSNLNNTYVYGGVAYSGSAVKNTTHVQGTISTPFNATIPATSNPVWAGGTYTSLGSGNPGILTAGTQASPARYKVSGDLTVSGGNVLTVAGNGAGTDGYIEVWITGKLTTSGTGEIIQDPTVHITYWVDNDITLSGNSYLNGSGLAQDVVINGVGTGHKFTDSGSAAFTGVINAPGFDATISGGGAYDGAIIANSLTLSGGSGLHYDEALNTNGTSSAIGNYAFASWFEDTR